MLNLTGFREWRWADRYLGFAATLAALVGVDLLLRGGAFPGLYWLAAAAVCVAMTPRSFLVLGIILGFVTLQALFLTVVRAKAQGLLIIVPAVLAAFGALELSRRRGEHWPAGPFRFDVVQLSVDLVVYLLLFYVVIRLT